MSYYDLRLKLHKLADRGLLDRAGCYALLEILETSSHRPDMGVKVEQATRLLETLADEVAVPTAPARSRIAIIGAPESVGSTIAAMQAHSYGRELDLTGISITRVELPSWDGLDNEGIKVADLLASDHHRPRPFFSTQLFGLIEDELAALDKPVELAVRMKPFYPETPKEYPQERFNGYMGKGKRGRWPRSR